MRSYAETLHTYFVDTHEFDTPITGCTLIEYFKYESGVYFSPDGSVIRTQNHDATLAIAIL